MDRDERGSGSVLVVALTAVVLLLGLAAAFVTATVAAHRKAQAAADLAAVAGATVLQRGGEPCAGAAVIAEANGAAVTSCGVIGGDVRVQVALDGPALAGYGWRLTGRARAGPATTS